MSPESCRPVYLSPDLALADFYMFSKLKISLKSEQFDYIEDIQTNTV